MKPISFLKISASLVALAAMVVTSTAQAETADIKITKVAGPATANGAAVRVGDVLKEGSTITTGAGGTVTAEFADSVLSVQENTEVVFEKTAFEKKGNKLEHNTKLELKKGGLIGDVKKISANSKYEVKHAQGVAGIRGTTWAILPGKGVICAEGSVLVSFVINGVALPPITLGPGQMVLPPMNGQPPVIIDVPQDLALFIVGVFRRFDPDGPGPIRERPVTPSAFAGLRGDVQVEVHTIIPEND